MPKLSELHEDIQKAIRYVVKEYGVLREFESDVNDLKRILEGIRGTKGEEAVLAKLKKLGLDREYFERAEAREVRLENRVISDAIKLTKDMPKKEVANLEHHMVEAIRLALKRIWSYDQEIRLCLYGLVRDVEQGRIRTKKETFKKELNDLYKIVNSAIKWVEALGADLKEADEIYEKAPRQIGAGIG